MSIVRDSIDMLLGWLNWLPPLAAILVLSAPVGVLALWIFGKTTNQKLIRAAKDAMAASVYEMRLFIDSPKRILLAQARLLWWSGRYTALTLVPLAIMALPVGNPGMVS
jgi:hypothetical protein